jgi:hypothetical protein
MYGRFIVTKNEIFAEAMSTAGDVSLAGREDYVLYAYCVRDMVS